MAWRPRNLGKLGAAVLAVLTTGLAPAAACAETLTFRNETNGPVIVQAACVVRGVLRRDHPYLLRAGDATPGIALPGNKIVTVYDGFNPNHVVFQGTVLGGMSDQTFGIAPDGTGGVQLNVKAAAGP